MALVLIPLFQKFWLKSRIFVLTNSILKIYWTAVAYSLWKIGHLPQDIKEKVLDIIAKGAHEFWLDIDSKGAQTTSKGVRYIAVQLQSENPKPLKVRKSKTKREPPF